jgi:hypothetical protein
MHGAGIIARIIMFIIQELAMIEDAVIQLVMTMQEQTSN